LVFIIVDYCFVEALLRPYDKGSLNAKEGTLPILRALITYSKHKENKTL
jgi:hypothetical protein